MVTNNQLLNIELLRTLLNKTLKNIKHDEFTFAPLSYGAIYLEFEDAIYQLSDFYKEIDYFGMVEDISVLKITPFNEEIKSYIVGHNIVSTKINMKITCITLVNVTKTITPSTYADNCDTLLDTIGIIFTFTDGYQFAFEKDDFGENISIYRGYNLEEKFRNIPIEFTENIIESYNGECLLEFEVLK